MLCPRCYSEFNDYAKFCPHCGLQINTQPTVQASKKNTTTIWIIIVITAAALLYGCAFLIGLTKNFNPKGISKAECRSMMNDYAYYYTEKNCEKLCELMLPDDVVKNTNGLVYVNMKLDITNSNLTFKSGLSDLFEEVEYKIEDPEFYVITEDQMQETENYYRQYFGCNVNVTDGYIVKGRWTTTKGFDYDVVFPIVKIENEGLKISPFLWHLNQGKPIQWLSTSGYGPNYSNSYPVM